MQSMYVIATMSALSFVALSERTADAARRRDNVDDFCRAASDLCVFTCSGDFDCPSLSDGYICESRHGTLVVEENGERTYYETDYSFCWHRTRPSDDPLPDPEEEPVPRWPGDGERAMCMQCKRQDKTCRAFVKHGRDLCFNYYDDQYTDYCVSAFKAGKRPSDRRGRPYQPKDKYCANVLDTDDALRVPNKTVASGPRARRGEHRSGAYVGYVSTGAQPQRSHRHAQQVLLGTLNSEYEDIGTDIHTRKRLLQARKKCEAKLVKECVKHFAEDMPD